MAVPPGRTSAAVAAKPCGVTCQINEEVDAIGMRLSDHLRHRDLRANNRFGHAVGSHSTLGYRIDVGHYRGH